MMHVTHSVTHLVLQMKGHLVALGRGHGRIPSRVGVTLKRITGRWIGANLIRLGGKEANSETSGNFHVSCGITCVVNCGDVQVLNECILDPSVSTILHHPAAALKRPLRSTPHGLPGPPFGLVQ